MSYFNRDEYEMESHLRDQRSAEPGSVLAAARQAAHRAFDPKWKSGAMTRSQAYNWLSQKLGIPKHDCHMLYFDVAMCERVVAICLSDDFEVCK